MDFTNESVQIRELLRKLERKLGILEKSEVSCCEVTFAQCHAIVEIGRRGAISLNELADVLNLDSSTMSRTVNNLVNDGYAERELDSKDRRYVTIRLTEKGVGVFEDIEEGMNSYFLKITQSIPEGKRKQVIDSLAVLLEAINGSNCC